MNSKRLAYLESLEDDENLKNNLRSSNWKMIKMFGDITFVEGVLEEQSERRSFRSEPRISVRGCGSLSQDGVGEVLLSLDPSFNSHIYGSDRRAIIWYNEDLNYAIYYMGGGISEKVGPNIQQILAWVADHDLERVNKTLSEIGF